MNENKYHLAQVNIGRILAPMDDPLMQDFANNLEPINALADSVPGFVWRLQTESGDATSIHAFEDTSLLVNMSVWQDVESLKAFTYHSAHVDFVRRRKEWFSRFEGMYMALWWIPAGHIPTVEEAKKRLAHLEQHGETPFAFTFKRVFAPGETAVFP